MAKQLISALLILVVLVLVAPKTELTAGSLADKLKISGELRYRMEGDARDFDSETVPHSFHYLRTRLNLDFNADSPVRVFIQTQDSRLLGSPSSGGLDNDGNLGVHQAFAHLDGCLFESLYHRIGRFEYAKGGQRLLGSVGWHNVGRTWDGLLTGYNSDNLSIEGFLLKIEEGVKLLNDDKDLLGVYAEIHDPCIDFFLLYDRDNYRSAEARVQDRYTGGLFSANSFSQIDYIANVAYQFGKNNYDTLDISACLLTLEIGYTTATTVPLRVAAGIDIASGDDDLGDDKIKTFNNLYYTGHKFRGHMDFFVKSESLGLNDYMLRVKYGPNKGWVLNGDFHMFTTNQDYASTVDGEDTNARGSEIDLYLSHKKKRVKIQAGISAFFLSEDWKGEEADNSLWAYFQMIVSF